MKATSPKATSLSLPFICYVQSPSHAPVFVSTSRRPREPNDCRPLLTKAMPQKRMMRANKTATTKLIPNQSPIQATAISR